MSEPEDHMSTRNGLKVSSHGMYGSTVVRMDIESVGLNVLIKKEALRIPFKPGNFETKPTKLRVGTTVLYQPIPTIPYCFGIPVYVFFVSFLQFSRARGRSLMGWKTVVT